MGDAENRLAEGGGRADQQHAQEERLRQQEEMKHSILSQILNQGARARLNTLKISRPEKAQMVEQMVVRMAQMGQIGGKMTEEALVELLETLNKQIPKSNSSGVKFDRRRAMDSDSDEDYGI